MINACCEIEFIYMIIAQGVYVRRIKKFISNLFHFVDIKIEMLTSNPFFSHCEQMFYLDIDLIYLFLEF